MTDIKAHLETIRDIDGTGYRRGRERAQALKALVEDVADALLTGRPVPVYTHVEEFFSVNGFAEAVANAIVAQGNSAVDQRYALAQHLEEKGVEHGREAARILREMNTQSAVLPWELPGSHIALPPMPGWHVERTPDGGAKGICESGIQFFLNGQNCGVVERKAVEHTGRRITLDEFDAGWGDSRARLAKARADLAEMKLAEMKADKPIDDFVRDAIAELGTNPETDAITHVLPVGSCWVEVKVERVVIDPLPDFDSVYPDDIQAGDHVEWHDDCSVNRWEVMSVSDWTGTKTGVILQSLHAPLYATQYVKLPLPFDPFILRPRS